jgi:hypothetical protein
MKRTGNNEHDCFVGKLLEAHTFTRLLVLVLQQKLEDIGWSSAGLLQSNAAVDLVVDILAEPFVFGHNLE